MRGEHLVAIALIASLEGSSPHARGAQVKLVHHERLDGIIPACAGSTSPIETVVPAMGDHPRMRGEHNADGVLGELESGSSPHARGAHERIGVAVVAPGIIPACAGSTLHDQRVWSTFSPNTFTFCKL